MYCLLWHTAWCGKLICSFECACHWFVLSGLVCLQNKNSPPWGRAEMLHGIKWIAQKSSQWKQHPETETKKTFIRQYRFILFQSIGLMLHWTQRHMDIENWDQIIQIWKLGGVQSTFVHDNMVPNHVFLVWILLAIYTNPVWMSSTSNYEEKDSTGPLEVRNAIMIRGMHLSGIQCGSIQGRQGPANTACSHFSFEAILIHSSFSQSTVALP